MLDSTIRGDSSRASNCEKGRDPTQPHVRIQGDCRGRGFWVGSDQERD